MASKVVLIFVRQCTGISSFKKLEMMQYSSRGETHPPRPGHLSRLLATLETLDSGCFPCGYIRLCSHYCI